MNDLDRTMAGGPTEKSALVDPDLYRDAPDDEDASPPNWLGLHFTGADSCEWCFSLLSALPTSPRAHFLKAASWTHFEFDSLVDRMRSRYQLEGGVAADGPYSPGGEPYSLSERIWQAVLLDLFAEHRWNLREVDRSLPQRRPPWRSLVETREDGKLALAFRLGYESGLQEAAGAAPVPYTTKPNTSLESKPFYAEGSFVPDRSFAPDRPASLDEVVEVVRSYGRTSSLTSTFTLHHSPGSVEWIEVTPAEPPARRSRKIVSTLVYEFQRALESYLGDDEDLTQALEQGDAEALAEQAADRVVAPFLWERAVGAKLDTTQVTQLLGVSRQAVAKRVAHGSLLGIAGRGTTYFPSWQFDVEARSVRPAVSRIVRTFREIAGSVDPLTIASWATTRQDEDLEGFTPEEWIRDGRSEDDVVAAATRAATRMAG